MQSAEEQGKEKRERITVVVGSPCQENYPADAHPSVLKSVLESANPAWTWSVHLDAPGQRHGQQPVSGTADPGVVKQDKSSRGSVDTTKTRSGPQRVRMSSGERRRQRQTIRYRGLVPTPPPSPRPGQSENSTNVEKHKDTGQSELYHPHTDARGTNDASSRCTGQKMPPHFL